MDTIYTLLNILVSSGVISVLLFYRSKKRKENAEATKVEVSVLRDFAEEWRKLAERREEELVRKDAKIDSLISDRSTLREVNVTLQLDNQHLHFRLCNKPVCSLRVPQTGF